ncbi:hypothetical protein PAPHI01_1354 [Pancytospora philotis]|nr:hypothetical protein PAPHI01_1354 [Pancytospora philotis]
MYREDLSMAFPRLLKAQLQHTNIKMMTAVETNSTVRNTCIGSEMNLLNFDIELLPSFALCMPTLFRVCVSRPARISVPALAPLLPCTMLLVNSQDVPIPYSSLPAGSYLKR